MVVFCIWQGNMSKASCHVICSYGDKTCMSDEIRNFYNVAALESVVEIKIRNWSLKYMVNFVLPNVEISWKMANG